MMVRSSFPLFDSVGGVVLLLLVPVSSLTMLGVDDGRGKDRP